jgi:hypothetical protein
VRYPFPEGDLTAWAYDLILALEAPRPADYQYERSQSNKVVSQSPYLVSPFDWVLLVDTTAVSMTLTLPLSKADGWECEIVKTTSPNRVIILPTGTDLIVGENRVEVYDQWTALHFRAVSGGYVII